MADNIKDKNAINNIVAKILQKENLQVNDTKTEHTIIQRKEKQNEEWRKVRKLGSLIGDTKDINSRKQKPSTTLNDMNKLWIR